MPVEGWKSISVRDDVYDALELAAKKANRNITNFVDTLLRKELEVVA